MHTVAFAVTEAEASPKILNENRLSNFIGDEPTDDNRKEHQSSAWEAKPRGSGDTQPLGNSWPPQSEDPAVNRPARSCRPLRARFPCVACAPFRTRGSDSAENFVTRSCIELAAPDAAGA